METLRGTGGIRALLLALGMLAFGSFLTGCVDDDDPFEEVGEGIDNAIDDID